MQRIWITGAGGLIGSWIFKTAPRDLESVEVLGLTRPQLDLADFPALEREFRRQKPQLVFHCAALTRTPDCQRDPALAHKLNVQLTAFLSELAAEVPFFFLSSDLVFDGRQGNYDESAIVNPLSVYGQTKAEAEQAVLRNPRHTVLRTSLNSGRSPTGDRSFDEQLRRAWAAGQKLHLFRDEFRCPIGAEVTARALWELAGKRACGLYHLAGSERLSRWQIGQVVAATCPELNPQLESASLTEYAGAPRAADTSLSCAKVQRLLSFPLPRWSDWFAAQVSSVNAPRHA